MTTTTQNHTPELLKALKGLLKHFEGNQSLASQSDLNSSCYIAEVEFAKEAISKAEGKTL